jgi:hypothetical protein
MRIWHHSFIITVRITRLWPTFVKSCLLLASLPARTRAAPNLPLAFCAVFDAHTGPIDVLNDGLQRLGGNIADGADDGAIQPPDEPPVHSPYGHRNDDIPWRVTMQTVAMAAMMVTITIMPMVSVQLQVGQGRRGGRIKRDRVCLVGRVHAIGEKAM